MRDLLTAAVRTAVATAVTAVIAWLAGFGIELDPTALEAVLAGLGVGVVNLALNWLQTQFPKFGYVLSLGMSRSNPTYT